MKRLEIVIDAEKLYDMIALLDSVGVRGYSFIKSVGGLGSRGERRPDGLFFSARGECNRDTRLPRGSVTESGRSAEPEVKRVWWNVLDLRLLVG